MYQYHVNYIIAFTEARTPSESIVFHDFYLLFICKKCFNWFPFVDRSSEISF